MERRWYCECLRMDPRTLTGFDRRWLSAQRATSVLRSGGSIHFWKSWRSTALSGQSASVVMGTSSAGNTQSPLQADADSPSRQMSGIPSRKPWIAFCTTPSRRRPCGFKVADAVFSLSPGEKIVADTTPALSGLNLFRALPGRCPGLVSLAPSGLPEMILTCNAGYPSALRNTQ